MSPFASSGSRPTLTLCVCLALCRSSNLCTEIIEYTSPDEVAVCNLASVVLPKFVLPNGTYDHQRLFEVTKVRNIQTFKGSDLVVAGGCKLIIAGGSMHAPRTD